MHGLVENPEMVKSEEMKRLDYLDFSFVAGISLSIRLRHSKERSSDFKILSAKWRR